MRKSLCNTMLFPRREITLKTVEFNLQNSETQVSDKEESNNEGSNHGLSDYAKLILTNV